jgi:hypothetical protein
MDGLSTNQGPGASSPWTWPLGGDVTQWIRTTWIKALSDQTGFININNVRAGDPEVERRIIEDVASYGRQLGRIMEALDVVIGHLRLGERTDVTADERRALQDFSDLVRQVQELKADTSPPRLTLAGLDRMLDDLQALNTPAALAFPGGGSVRAWRGPDGVDATWTRPARSLA